MYEAYTNGEHVVGGIDRDSYQEAKWTSTLWIIFGVITLPIGIGLFFLSAGIHVKILIKKYERLNNIK